MRPIKFRGLSEDGVWYFGYYEKYHGRHRITNEELYGNKIYFVDGKTIGQFTGLLDKNGKEIYEGDICYKKGYGKKCVIRFNEEWLKYEAFYGIGDNGGDLTVGLGHWNKKHCDICNEKEQITEAIFGNTLEIIGNIYENPDLLTNN